VSYRPAHAVRRLKDGGRRSVWLIHRPGQGLRTLKSWPLTPLLLLKLALGVAQPQRHGRGAKRLARAGIATPEICRCGKARDGLRVELELLWCPGRDAFELMSASELTEPECRRASAAVGGIVHALIAAGLFDRDLKLSNLIVDLSPPRAVVWLIDTVEVKPLRKPVDQIARMLERLSVQPARCNVPIAPSMWIPLLRRALAGLPAATRRAVIRHLKTMRQRDYA
jgi:hypothetical protein